MLKLDVRDINNTCHIVHDVFHNITARVEALVMEMADLMASLFRIMSNRRAFTFSLFGFFLLGLGIFLASRGNFSVFDKTWTDSQKAIVPGDNHFDTTGLAALWHLDEMSGTMTDSTDFSNNSSLVSGTYGQNGKLGKAFFFDGSGDYIQIDGTTVFATQHSAFSVAAWAYLNSFTNSHPDLLMLRSDSAYAWHVLLSNSRDYEGISFGSTNTWAAIKTGTAPKLLLNRWMHIVVTYNGQGPEILNNFRIFLDSVEQPLSVAGSYGATTQQTVIGSSLFAPGNDWHGLIDEVSIWSRQLSADEIRNLYLRQNGRSGSKP